uniref:Immunoglobulin V-set domain-containing protein n=1 Tax=Sinocyclocheilus grahami TaxID=75366 RepID=A0A672KXU4_SINGR
IYLNHLRFPGHVFVQTGGSVKLDIKNKTLLHFSRLIWMNDKSENIVRFINESGGLKYYIYKDSVDFNNKTLSLTLKNTQKTDSGLYTAKTIREKTTLVAEYNVSVIDPVDFPVLKRNFTIISVHACIVNVSCSGRDHTISDSYHSNNCTQEKVKSFGIQTLALYCIDNVVVCNYSNPVSWKNDIIEINQLCTPHEQNNSSFPLHWLLVIAGVLVLVFTAVSVLYCTYKKRKKSMSALIK